MFMLYSSLTGIDTPTLSPGNRFVPLGELEAVWGGVLEVVGGIFILRNVHINILFML